jgi:hypothetical protein
VVKQKKIKKENVIKKPKLKKQEEEKSKKEILFLGDKLKALREIKGFKTPEDFCRMMADSKNKSPISITGQSMRNHELSLHEPKFSVVKAYADLFGVDIEYFYNKKRGEYENVDVYGKNP